VTSSSTLAIKFWRLGWPERRLVIEAAALLAIARVMTLVLPFRQIARLASHPIRDGEHPIAYRSATIERIRRSIARCAGHVPWRTKCFEQGLAAQIMLRRRGVASTLYYGAAPGGTKGLVAHVWVRDRETDVIGGEIASQYAVLAAFPSPSGGRTPKSFG
jgi:hypothetical protein